MSLLGQVQQQLLLQQTVLPYTFTTGELDSLKSKLQSAEAQILQTNKGSAILQMTRTEMNTLLRMIDMTYLQGLRYDEWICLCVYVWIYWLCL